MRFAPFGSGSNVGYTVSASVARYSDKADYGLRAISASYAISGGVGPVGDNGSPSVLVGPHPYYPIC